MSLAGMITHAGTQDIENVYVDWGDSSGVDSGECGLVAFPGSGECSTGVVAVPNQIDLKSAGGLTLTPDASNTEVGALRHAHVRQRRDLLRHGHGHRPGRGDGQPDSRGDGHQPGAHHEQSHLDVRAHRQQPYCHGQWQRLRPRLDRGLGRYAL